MNKIDFFDILEKRATIILNNLEKKDIFLPGEMDCYLLAKEVLRYLEYEGVYYD